jgi:hypothetical protein
LRAGTDADGRGFLTGDATMGREEKFDLDNVANELARHGPVESIKWVGDPEKMSEIFERSAKASSRILARHRDYAQYGRMSKPVAKTG